MKLFPFFRAGKPAKERIFALDIGDLFLKFAFCEKEGDRIRTIFWRMEELNILFWHRPLEQLWNIIQESYGLWKKTGGRSTRKVVVSFSASSSKVRVAEYGLWRAHPEIPVGEKEENSFRESIRSFLEGQLKEELALSTGLAKEDLLLASHKILGIWMDGYRVPAESGLKGRKVKWRIAALYLFRRHREVLAALQRESRWEPPLITHGTFSALSFSRARQKAGMFIDVGEKITNITVAKEGDLVWNQEFPFGGERFGEVLEQSLGMSGSSARELKERYGKRLAEEPVRARLHSLFLPKAQEFATLIRDTVKAAGIFFPPRIYLFGGGAMVPELAEMFVGMFEKALPGSEKVEAELLVPNDIFEISNFPQLNNPQYTPLFLSLLS